MLFLNYKNDINNYKDVWRLVTYRCFYNSVNFKLPIQYLDLIFIKEDSHRIESHIQNLAELWNTQECTYVFESVEQKRYSNEDVQDYLWEKNKFNTVINKLEEIMFINI